MAKQYFAYNYVAKIAYVERGNRPQKSLHGEFFDTWSEAYVLITKQAIERLVSSRSALSAAEKHMKNVNNMKNKRSENGETKETT